MLDFDLFDLSMAAAGAKASRSSGNGSDGGVVDGTRVDFHCRLFDIHGNLLVSHHSGC